MSGDVARYFLFPPVATPGSTVFVVSNYLGLVSAVVLSALIAISNNSAIRALGIGAWKRIQRTAYVAFVAAMIHGLFYQTLEHRTALLIGITVVMSALSIGLQLKGRVVARSSRLAAPRDEILRHDRADHQSKKGE